MRRPLVLAALLVAALAGASEASARSRCATPSHGVVVASGPSVVVQRVDRGEARTWTACRRSTGRRLVVLRGGVSEASTIGAEAFRVQGRFVAFGRIVGMRGGGSVSLVRADTAGVGRVEELGPYGPSTGVDSRLTALQLTSRGVVLLTSDSAYDYDFGQGPTSRIGVADGAGFRLLEVAALGAITRPALTGTTASWAVGGVGRTATLTPR